MVQNILIEVLGSFAESERLAIKGRQREGKDFALSRGKRVRRPWIERPDNWEETIENWRGSDYGSCCYKKIGHEENTVL